MKYILPIFALMLLGAGCTESPLSKATDAYDMAADTEYTVSKLESRIEDLESRLNDMESLQSTEQMEISDLDDKVNAMGYSTADVLNDVQDKTDKMERWLKSETNYPWY
jgi:septation ring formation regulator EzrA